MIKNILKQIWSCRKGNIWLFIQLFVIFIATWLVIDPLYTMLYQTKMFDKGFDIKNIYSLSIDIVHENLRELIADNSQSGKLLDDFNAIMARLKAYPGITAVAPVTSRYVGSGSYSMNTFYNGDDTTRTTDAYYMSYFSGTDYFKVFRFRESGTGRYYTPDSVRYIRNGAFITGDTEELLFGKGRGKGKYIVPGGSPDIKYKVAGVLDNIVIMPGYQPIPVIIQLQDNYTANEKTGKSFLNYLGMNGISIVFRVKDGTDEDLFLSSFNKELFSGLTSGVLSVTDIQSLESKYNKGLYYEGIPSGIFIQSVLTGFFMINILLAVFATFRMRIRKRRGEIGIMMALGSSRRGVKSYFIKESLVLFALSAIAGIIALIQIVHFKGLYSMYDYQEYLTPSFTEAWAINNEIAHFIIVTLLVIIIIGGTVLSGTLIPASGASGILPSDALREE